MMTGNSGFPSLTRILGRVRGEGDGPTLVAIGGLHGNEPAGVVALQEILGPVSRRVSQLRGEFVAVAGNRGALARGRRFLEQDLNRLWTGDRLLALESGTLGDLGPETVELEELIRTLDEIAERARGPLFILDLHTTSSPSGPWIAVEDTVAGLDFALRFPVPLILGLDRKVEGTLLAHARQHGFDGLGFEAGQHEDPRSVERLRAAIWIGLAAAGLLPPSGAREVVKAQALLQDAAGDLPRALEIVHRHGIEPDDHFRMRPGYDNLQTVKEDEVLGYDGRGEVRSPTDGRILMPLYQEQGNDGFFLARELDLGEHEAPSVPSDEIHPAPDCIQPVEPVQE